MVQQESMQAFAEEGVELDQYLVFQVKSQEFGLRAKRVQEISVLLDTTQVPRAPPYIEGIVNLRGRLASVINFRKKFGFEPKEHDEDTRLILLEQGGFPIGIVVDSVEEVMRIPDEAVQGLPESTTTSVSMENIVGVGMVGERLIILLDVDKILSEKELVEVGELGREAAEPVKTREEAPPTKKREAPKGKGPQREAGEKKGVKDEKKDVKDEKTTKAKASPSTKKKEA